MVLLTAFLPFVVAFLLASDRARYSSSHSRFGFHGRCVSAEDSGASAPGAMVEGGLPRFDVLALSTPRPERFVLQGAPVRETKLPRLWSRHLTDRAEVVHCRAMILAPR